MRGLKQICGYACVHLIWSVECMLQLCKVEPSGLVSKDEVRQRGGESVEKEGVWKSRFLESEHSVRLTGEKYGQLLNGIGFACDVIYA